jgi:hypothetical protein
MEIHILDWMVSLVLLSTVVIQLRKAGMPYYDIFPFVGTLSIPLILLFGLFDVVDFFTLIKYLIFNSKIKL